MVTVNITRKFTRQDWENIMTALNMVAAGDWDDGSYGERPDFEDTIAKVRERRQFGSHKPAPFGNQPVPFSMTKRPGARKP